MKYDVIIIGSGLGGLTAGAKLAKEGRKVLVIEQHNKPGGCATTFQRGDYTLEVGLHEMDSPTAGDMKTRIFNDLDVFKKVRFLKLPEFYHFVNGRYEITIPHDPKIAIERLCGIFPGESDGINAYFNHILSPRKKSQDNEKIKDKSVGEFLDSIIRNDDLKLVLLGNLGYFNDDPYSLSMAYYSVAQGSYFLSGGSYIREGSQKLSDYLADYIKAHGGDVILNHIVTEINTSGNRAVCVAFKKQTRSDSDTINASGDEIIVNSALPGLAQMLPEKHITELQNDIKGEEIGPSLLTIYFGFRRSLRELGHKYYSTFIYDDSVRTQADILKNNKDDFSRRSFTLIDYGQIDSGLAPEGKSVGSLCCIDYLKDWERLTPDEYKLKKERVAGLFIDRLQKLIPGIKDVIDYYEVGTSLTVKRYTLNPQGATHGFTQPPDKKGTNYLKSIDNLHIASAWGKTGGGYSGVIYGGYLCALGIMRKKTVNIKK
jgi:phytoene dehydrogenase-like protein